MLIKFILTWAKVQQLQMRKETLLISKQAKDYGYDIVQIQS